MNKPPFDAVAAAVDIILDCIRPDLDELLIEIQDDAAIIAKHERMYVQKYDSAGESI